MMRRTLALAVVCLLAFAGPAVAARRLVAHQSVAGAPAIAGDNVVFGGYTPTTIDVTTVGPDGGPHVIASLPRPHEDDPLDFETSFFEYSTFEVHGSATHAAYRLFQGEAYKADPRDGNFQISTGPLDGPLTKLIGGNSDQLVQRAFDVDGDRIAYAGDGVVVRDLAAQSDIVTLPSRSLDVRLAGRYLAYVDPAGNIVAYDVDARRQLYSVTAPGCTFDVQADGKLVTACASGGITWYSPTDLSAHSVAAGGDIAPGYEHVGTPVAIDGDTIAYPRKGAGLGVTDLAGHFRALAADVIYPAGFDLQGGKLAYATPGCSSDTGAVWLDDLSGPAAGSPPPPCQIVVDRTKLRVSRGVVRIPVSCPTGCRGSVGILLGRLSEDTYSTPFELKAGGRASIAVRVAGARKPRRTRTVHLYVAAAIDGGPGIRHQRVTIAGWPR